jgi:hypothetical protein
MYKLKVFMLASDDAKREPVGVSDHWHDGPRKTPLRVMEH